MRIPKTPSSRQQSVYAFICRRWQESGLSPSSREIQQAFGFRSQTAAMNHLRALEKQGILHRVEGRGRARGWIPQDLPDDSERNGLTKETTSRRYLLPILGSIAAGLPEAGLEQTEELLPVDLEGLSLPSGRRFFGLKVRGDSMVGAHILEGDIVVMEFRPPRPGDVVAALIDGDTTLKRFVVKNGRTYLRAENPSFPDLIPAQELVIQGVLVALLRHY